MREGTARRAVSYCAIDTKSDRHQIQACDGHRLQCVSSPFVDEATDISRPREPVEPEPPVDPIRHAAAEMGRRGGLKGGPARAAKLSARKRSEIAKIAARKRWGKN
jgi:hypothetical protein